MAKKKVSRKKKASRNTGVEPLDDEHKGMIDEVLQASDGCWAEAGKLIGIGGSTLSGYCRIGCSRASRDRIRFGYEAWQTKIRYRALLEKDRAEHQPTRSLQEVAASTTNAEVLEKLDDVLRDLLTVAKDVKDLKAVCGLS